uniref:Odorant receptor n=1 Tax=Bradysia odoriphaga TaxID=1564500 RepID=A0A6B9C9P9_9DIPT|nr:odorant receptor 6 [Bradysia odoriphaga]
MEVKIQSKKKSHTTETIRRKENADNDTTTLKRIFDFSDIFSNIVGWKFSYDWKINPKHCFTCLVVLDMWTQFIYSQILFFKNGEYSRFFGVLATYGIGASFIKKFWIFVKSYKALAALRHFSFKINRKADRNMAEKLNRHQLKNFKLCKIVVLSASLSYAAFTFYPLTQLVFNRKFVSLLPIEIMFLDQTKWSGFIIATAIVAVTGVWVELVFFSININFLMAIFNCSTQVILIEDDFKKLDAFWSNPKTTNLVERHMFLRNICQKCQDRDKFMDAVKGIFDGPIFYYFCVTYMAQIICLYEIQMMNWIPGYGFSICGFLEMLLYCIIGTEVSKINERLFYVLTQSKWYTYDMCSQKIFLDLLNSCMNAKELSIGPLAPLSVISWIQIVKSIYSYYTFLSEVV